MTTTATLVYKAFQGGGVGLATLNALLASVPAAPDVLAAYGCRVTSDATVNGPPVARTIVIALGPSSTATAAASVQPSDVTGSPVTAVAVTGAGADYILPPIVQFTGGRAAEPPAGIVDNDELAPSAAAVAYLKIVAVAVNSGGSLYSAATTIQPSSGLKPGGRHAVFTPIIGGGIITGVTIVDAGDGYTSPPKLIVNDSTGSGAVLTASMGVGRISVTRGGKGYVSAPTVALIPAFQVMFPSGQAGPFKHLLTAALAQATAGPIDAEPPLIA